MTRPAASRRCPDVVVVGGGIVGCATTYYLARAGLRTLLLERDAIAGATSGCCMGHLMVVPDPLVLHRLTRASVALWSELAGQLGTFELAPTGALWLAECDDDLALLAQLEAGFEAHGDGGQMLDRAALSALEPGVAGDLPGAFFYPNDGIVMPMLAAGALLRAAVAMGAEVRTGVAVDGIRRTPAGAVAGVLCGDQEIATPRVVNAAGVWAPWLTELAGLGRAPIFPRRGDLAITMPREVPVRHQLLEVGYLRTTNTADVDPEGDAVDPGALALNVQPQTHGTCLIGATRQFGGYRRVVDRGLLDRSLRRAVRFVPGLAGARLTRTWAGLRPYTRDHLPIIGPVAEVPGFIMAAGHEGLGITLAPITGQLVAQAVVGEPTALPLSPVSLERFASGVPTHG